MSRPRTHGPTRSGGSALADDRGQDISVTRLTHTIAQAVLAPSLHNSQPWRFRIHPTGISVRLDPERRLPASDPDDRAARMACGAAIYNLRLALAVEVGVRPQVRLLPDPDDHDLLAEVTFQGPADAHPATPREQDLYRAIAQRHSNRYPFDPAPVEQGAVAAMVDAADVEGGWLAVLTDPAHTGMVGALVRRANQVLHADADYQREIRAWIRPDTGAAEGITVRAAGYRPAPHDTFPARDYGGRERPPDREYEETPVLAALGTLNDAPRDHLTAGQALQAVLLTATDHGLAVSLFSQPVDVAATRDVLREVVQPIGYPQILLRIGYATRYPTSPRRPVANVIDLTD